MMRQKIFWVFVILLFLGCSSQQPLTLRVVMGLTEEEWSVMREEVFPLFEQKYACRIQAYQIEAADWPRKLEAMVGGGDVRVDVFSQDNMQLYRLVEKGLIEDLTEYADKIPEPISARMRSVGKFGEKIYFFPYRPNVQITYYNEKKFRQYQFSLPKDWQELVGVARIFKEREGVGRVGLKLWGNGPTTTQLYELIVSAGGDPFSFNDQGCIKAFTFLQVLYPYLSPDSKKAKWDTTNTYLANGSFYLAQNWPFATRIIVKDYGKTHIKAYKGPKGPSQRAHVVGGEVLGIPKGAPQKELALAFIFFLESKEVQETLVKELGWPSVRDDAYASVKEWQKPYFKAVEEALAAGVYRPNVLYWGEFDKFLNEAATRIMIKNEPVTKVLDEYHEKMKAVKDAYQSHHNN